MISFNRSILTCIIASLLANATRAFDLSFQAKESKKGATHPISSSSRTTNKNEFELQMNHDHDGELREKKNSLRNSAASNNISFDLPTEESIMRFRMKKTNAPNHWEGFSGGSTRDNAFFLLSPDGRSITGSFQGPTGNYYMIRTQPDDKIIVEVIPQGEMKEEDEGLFPPSDLSADKEDANNIVSRADSGDSVDLMVVYTMNAMCLQAGLSSPCTNNAANRLPIENLIQLAVNNNNAAHTNSATGVQMNLVHTYLAADYTEPGDTSTALYDLTYTSSQGYPALDEVHSLRDTYGADMVMLMGSIGTGIAWVESSSSFAFSYMNRSYVSYHTMAHELGHNWGCYHDRDNSSTQVDYAHGYQDPGGAFRSILSYDCPGGCTRVNWYSSPDVTYNGATIGTSTEDCARKIQERRDTVANFRQHVEGPTPTPPSPTPPSPTPSNCSSTERNVKISFLTDSWSVEDNAWTLANAVTGVVVASRKIGDLLNYTPYEDEFCVPKSSCFDFNVEDKYGDGLLSDGYLVVSVDEVPKLSITSFDGGWFEKKVQFGNCSTPPSPTPPSPTPPSPTPPSPTPPSGSVMFRNKVASSTPLCMAAKGTFAGAAVVTKACSSTDALQQFEVDSIGRLHLQSASTKCLKKSNAKIVVANCGSTNIFKFAHNEFDSRLVNYAAPLANVVSITNDTAGVGAVIKFMSYNNNAQTQGWEVVG